MGKLCVFFVLALIASEAMCMSFRHKRQAPQEDGSLEDRYGWDRPNGPWAFPNIPFPGSNGRFPQQGRLPGQGQSQSQVQLPGSGQFQTQGQIPGQGQFPGQGQLPGQGQFPGQGQLPGSGQLPGQGQPPNVEQQQQTTPATNSGSTTTTLAPEIVQCRKDCLVTPEYNPVCGTNMVTYTNPGRLLCDQGCGLNVSLLRASPCPPAST